MKKEYNQDERLLYMLFIGGMILLIGAIIVLTVAHSQRQMKPQTKAHQHEVHKIMQRNS